MRADRPVTLAAITGAHGVRGEVRLKLFGEALGPLTHGALQLDDPAGAVTPSPGLHTLHVSSMRDDGKGGAIARFTEVVDRAVAEGLRGRTLSVPRVSLPMLAAGEYYHVDLLGLAVFSDDGRALGTVVAVENFGAGDILEIERSADTMGRFMVPMRADVVLTWDDERLVVNSAYTEE